MNNVFHDHLDVCKQCREHPFDLCVVGAATMRSAIAIHSTRVDPNKEDVLKLAKKTALELSEEDCQLILQMKERPLKISHVWRATTIHEKSLTTWTSDGWVLSSFGRKVLQNILEP